MLTVIAPRGDVGSLPLRFHVETTRDDDSRERYNPMRPAGLKTSVRFLQTFTREELRVGHIRNDFR